MAMGVLSHSVRNEANTVMEIVGAHVCNATLKHFPQSTGVTVPSILAEKEARLRLILEYLRERELPKVVEDEHRVEADFYFSA